MAWKFDVRVAVDTVAIVIVLGMVLTHSLVVSEPIGELQELCTNEIFKATCGADEIISVTEAKYGRMRESRCVVKNYGYIGCYGDVMSIADNMCSGRHSCSIRVPNEHLDAVDTGCPEDFKSYFEARYVCVKVATPQHGGCRPGHPIELTASHDVISSIVTSETRCGNSHTPWLISVPPGQRVNLTLTDYSYGSPDNVADHTRCYGYATIKDVSTDRTTPVCGGRSRDSHVYTSIGNKLQVLIFERGAGVSTPRYFSLAYSAIGCPDPSPSFNGWFRREGDQLVIGCNDSEDVTTLTCDGTRWDREVKNCSVHAASKGQTGVPFMFSLSYEIAIAIIIAIALLIASAILCIGIVCMRRLQEERGRQLKERLYMERAQQQQQQQQYMTQLQHHPELGGTTSHKIGHNAPCMASYEQYRTGENLYASIQENLMPPASGGVSQCGGALNECKSHHDMCTCVNTASGPYSSLETGGVTVAPEPISPTSRSECSSILYPESGSRPYYVLDSREGDHVD